MADLPAGHSKTREDSPRQPNPPLWLLGAITLGGTLGIHIFAPALPLAARAMDAPPAALQFSIGIYVLGLAFGQLVHGPAADCYGRRPVLLAGTALYVLGGIAAVLAPSPVLLFSARLLQAFGGCSGLVIARSIVRDVSTGTRATADLAKLNLVMLLGPGLGPVIGGFTTSAFGWRAPLVLLTLIGAMNFVAVWFLLAETGMRSGRLSPISGYLRLLKNSKFLGYSVGGGIATTSWYAFIGAAPFLYQNAYGHTPSATGICLGVIVCGAWFGSLAASRLAHANSSDTLIRKGQRLSFVTASLLLVILLGTGGSTIVVTALMFGFTCGVGLTGPASLAQATSIDERLSATGAGLYGFLQMAIGALATALLGLADNPGVTSAAILAGGAIMSALCFTIGRRST